MNKEELAQRALLLEALRQVVNEEAWDARCKLETSLFVDVPDEQAWLEKAMEITEGKVETTFTNEGFYVMNPQRFEQWAVAHGFAHMEWVVDEEAALKELDASGGMAYFDGEEVPGVVPTVAVPNGVSLHPSKTAKQSVKEALSERLHQIAGNPA